jgi:cytochrome c5
MFAAGPSFALRALVLLGALAGCSPRAPAPPARTPAQVEALRPAEARLAAVYERACFLCHARSGTGAPLVGDTAAWAPRLAKGRDALVAQVRQGLGGMPALGLCPDCSDADFAALIDFMGRPEGAR